MINRKDIVCHPGIYIKDAIDELGLNQSEFAYRSGLSIKNVSTLLNGESDVTIEVAMKLAAFFGNSVEGWINLQTRYDVVRIKKLLNDLYKDEWQIAKQFDKDYIRDVLNVDINPEDRVNSINVLRKCFNVGTLSALKKPDLYAFHKTSISKDLNETTIIMRNAWISLAEQKARKIKCEPFNKEKLLSNITNIKKMSLERPETFIPKLKSLLSSCGIKLVILPYLPKSNTSGITKWINNDSCVLIAINDCGKVADRFWFTLFHELGHAIKNHKRHLTISYTENNIIDQDELDANAFAEDNLIDKKSYLEFLNNKQFDISNIQKFAKKQNVADFIVVGRLQKDGIISWNLYQDRKIKYNIL